MKTIIRALLAASLAGGLVSAAVGAAAAATGDMQTVSQAAVSACVNASNTGALVYPWEGVYNTSTSQTVTLDCSVPNGTESLTQGASIDIVYVFAYDGSTAANIRCNLNVLSAQGFVQFTASTGTSSGTGNYLYNVPVPNGVQGAAYASCNLPKAENGSQSGIYTVATFSTLGM